MKKVSIFIFIILLLAIISSSSVYACYAVIAGKNATADGSVLFAHSELNSGQRFLNFRVVPRIKYEPGAVIQLTNGGIYPEVSESYSFIWSENFGMRGSDSYINEWGVACASDGTRTIEDSRDELIKRGDIIDGGIGYMLRRQVARRARTAREGVHIVGELIKRFGCNFLGVSLVIADPNEAWVVSMAGGQHWVAQRVPDDRVVVLANVNIIGEVNLQDTNNFLASPNLIEYAIIRGWYNPKSEKPFNYKDAFGKQGRGWFDIKYGCDARQWRGQCLVTGKDIPLPIKENLPFSVTANRKMTVQDMRDILSDHLEGTEFDKTDAYKLGSPHDMISSGDGGICSQHDQENAIFQLRNWLPPEIGCIYWRTSSASCSGVLIPWYLGITKTPDSYYLQYDLEENLTIDFHFNPPSGTFDYNPEKAYWVFNILENLVDLNYKKNIGKVREVWNEFEAREYAMQAVIDETALKLFKEDKNLCREFLTAYSSTQAIEAMEMAKKMNKKLRTRLFGS